MEEGIESLSLNPDTVVETWLYLAREVSPREQSSARDAAAKPS
jgi:pyruvate,water dikinase